MEIVYMLTVIVPDNELDAESQALIESKAEPEDVTQEEKVRRFLGDGVGFAMDNLNDELPIGFDVRLAELPSRTPAL
jgi:hypothetical protein